MGSVTTCHRMRGYHLLLHPLSSSECSSTVHWTHLTQAEERKAADAAALHLAGFLFYTHSFERARAILEQQLQPDIGTPIRASRTRVQTLLAFVLLQQQAQELPDLQDLSELQSAHRLFDAACCSGMQTIWK